MPSIIDNIFMATLQPQVLYTLPFVKLTCISSLMVITNSAVNFVLYCVFGQKFRGVFVNIFCRRSQLSSREKATFSGKLGDSRGSSVYRTSSAKRSVDNRGSVRGEAKRKTTSHKNGATTGAVKTNYGVVNNETKV